MTRVWASSLDDFDGVALQRAHLDHLLEVVLEHRHIDEADVEAGEEELAGPRRWMEVAVAAARALCQSLLKSRQRGSPFLAASKTSSGSMSRKRRRMARWPMMPSMWPRPPQPQ